MKLLFDQNISHRLISKIKDFLPHAYQIRDLGLENSTDKQLWEYARKNDFIIVTFDGDFYDFSIVWGHPPKIIWLRTFNQSTNNVETILRKHFETIKKFTQDTDLACLEIIESI